MQDARVEEEVAPEVPENKPATKDRCHKLS